MLMALLCGQAASAAEWEGQIVAQIQFVPRTQPLSQAELLPLLSIETGQPVAAADINQSIHSLFATGRFANIEVDTAPAAEGVNVIFYTEPSWFVGSVTVVGVEEPPNLNQLVNATGLRLGEMYTPRKEAEALGSLRNLLIDNGLMNPLIEVTVDRHPEGQQADIQFLVHHLPRASFGRLLLTGDTGWSVAEAGRIADWKAGKEFTFQRLLDGLDRLRQELRAQGYWQANVSVVAKDYDSDDNVTNLVVNAVRGPQIEVRIEGFELSESRRRTLLPVYDQGAADQGLMAEGARNLRDFLQLKGYLDAQVDYELERDRAEQATVVYRVDRGRRMRLASVAIRGVRYFDAETVNERILIRPSTLRQRRGAFSTGLLQRDIEAIRNLYLLNGFRDVQISSNLDTSRGVGELYIDVIEGRPTIVENLTLSGDETYPIADRYFQLASAEGQAFSESHIATDRDLILSDYFDSGYQDAAFSWTVTPTQDPYRVDLAYNIVEGPQLFIDRPIVSGLVHTEPELVASQLVLTPNAPLSQTAMFETQRRLYDLGVFTKVDIEVQNPEGEEAAKTLLVRLQEARRWTFGFGPGGEFGRIARESDTDANSAEFRFVPRATVEINRLNLRGKGHTLSFRSRVSELQQRILFSYENPRWTGSENWKMTTSGLVDRFRNFSTFSGRKLEGVFQLEQHLSKPSTALYRYTYRRTTLDARSISAALVPLDGRAVRTALFSGTYIQDRRDDPTDSTRGLFNSVDLSFASKYWGSEPDFARVFGQNSTYYSLTKRVVLARTTQLGFFIPWGEVPALDPAEASETDTPFGVPDSRIPLVERFFGGGPSANRGFSINEAGPRSLTRGVPIGGGALFLNSVELRFPVIGDSTSGVLFHDAGNVFSRLSNLSFNPRQGVSRNAHGDDVFDFDYLVHAVGLGLRYRTPIGPIRVDVGYSINPPRYFTDSGEGMDRAQQRLSHVQFHFSLGQTF
jgi:outer membrane protein assembly complex protein YaeT